MSERLVVGLVRGVHGLRGDVRVEVLTDRAERRFAAGSVLFREGSPQPLTVAAAHEIVDGPGWRVRFAELRDRTAAETLRGVYLEAEIDPADALDPGSVYWHDLIGVAVTGLDGAALGTVHDVYEVGGTQAIVVRGGAVGEFDVPLVRTLVHEFDPRDGRLVVDAVALDLSAKAGRPAGERPRGPRRRPGSRRRTASTGSSDPSRQDG